MTGRGGRRRRQLLDEIKDRRGYCKLREKALDNTAERSLLKRLWNCRQTDNRMMMMMMMMTTLHLHAVSR